MKLTTEIIKNLIKEELQRLDEGAATIAFLLAYRQYLEKQEADLGKSDMNLPVRMQTKRRKRLVTAILFLQVVATIAGHLGEQMQPDEMSYGSLEDKAVNALRMQVMILINSSMS